MSSTTVPDALRESLALARVPVTRPVRTLLMLSGGLDSTALLLAFLRHTDHELHGHHIELRNRERRAPAESRAMKRILDWCDRHERPFERSESTHEFQVTAGAGADTTLTLFTAARVCYALRNRMQLVVTGHIRPAFRELSEGDAVFHASFIRRSYQPRWLRPFALLEGTERERKAVIRDSMDPELAAATWWCRRPTGDDGDVPCGRCHACTAMADAPKAEPS